MHIRAAVKGWRYLGYDRDTYFKYRKKLDEANMNVLRLVCGVLSFIMFMLAVVFGLLRRDLIRCVMAIGSGLLLMAVYGRSDGVVAGKLKCTRARALVLTLTASISLYLESIMMGTVFSDGDLAVMFIMALMLVSISLDLPPVQTLLTDVPAIILFCFLSHHYKSSTNFFYDIVHTQLAFFMSLVVSYQKTRLKLQNIISGDSLKKANFALYHTSTTDELTGLPNRRQIFECMEKLRERCNVDRTKLACIVFDIDDFKRYNDIYGHPAGDELLRSVGAAFSECAKKFGISVGRIGGEEFMAVWEERSCERAELIAEQMRASVRALNMPHEGTGCGVLTLTAGLCIVGPGEVDVSYELADRALYRAKDAGKNCTWRFDRASAEYSQVTCAEAAS